MGQHPPGTHRNLCHPPCARRSATKGTGDKVAGKRCPRGPGSASYLLGCSRVPAGAPGCWDPALCPALGTSVRAVLTPLSNTSLFLSTAAPWANGEQKPRQGGHMEWLCTALRGSGTAQVPPGQAMLLPVGARMWLAQATMNDLVFSIIFSFSPLIFWPFSLIFESFLHFCLTSLIFGSFQVWAHVGDRDVPRPCGSKRRKILQLSK